MKASEQLSKFFEIMPHNHQRVAKWYNPNMEVQILVAQDEGEPVAGRVGVFSSNNHAYEWYNLRLPKNANSDPINNDHELKYPLDLHAEAIGLTGWDFVNQQSIRGGFDFDTITGHAKGVGVSTEQLTEVQTKALNVPELLVLRSTGGGGLHLYLEFDPNNYPQTANHTEHAGLMIACLKEISRRVGFDFQASMDVGGGNMWIWHRKMTPESSGLTLIKDNVNPDGSKAYMKPPENWELYVDVAARKRTKVRIQGAPESEENDVINQAAAQQRIPLDDAHKRLIADLQGYSSYSTIWVDDHHLLQTHTRLLKTYFDDRAKSDKPLIGDFDTIAIGKDPGKPNCYCFPVPNGAWRIVRFGKGTNETKLWRINKSGWTCCYYNKPLTLQGAADAFGGLETDLNGKGYSFPDGNSAIAALRSMGESIEVPELLINRTVNFKAAKNKISLEIDREKSDPSNLEGWVVKRGKWIRVCTVDGWSNQNDDLIDYDFIDQKVRALISSDKSTHGWAILHENGFWIFTNKDDARSKLLAHNFNETESILGTLLSRSWMIAHLPFQDEFPGNRRWNLKAPKLRFLPTSYDDNGESPHPHWDMILQHVGTELNPYLREMSWAQRSNIKTGADYLLRWIALMLREPFEPLPYLYLWGPQCSGKSMLHEAISLLMQGGVMRADAALTNPSDFNGELAGAVLCVVEEKNISANATAVYNKLKDLVTSITIPIHAKYKQVYMQPNTTHWIQCANAKDHVPIFPGDTRVTMIYVDHLAKEVPQKIMLQRLEEEAPYFMWTLMNIPLPDIEHRLRLPVVTTGSKSQLEDSAKTLLHQFIDDNCVYAPGKTVIFEEFCQRFLETVSSNEKEEWTKRQIIGQMPHQYSVGNYNGIKSIGNLTFTPINEPINLTEKPLIYMRGALIVSQ